MPVQRFRKVLVVTAGAYSANDVVGGRIEFAGFINGTLQKITICDAAAQAGAYRMVFFESVPTDIADNSTYDIDDADLVKIIYIDLFPDSAGVAQSFTDNKIYYLWNLDVPMRSTGTIYAFLIADGTPTYAATTDVTVTLQVETEGKRAGLSS